MKKCTKCKKVKPLTEFYKAKEKKGGRYSSCKECDKKYRNNVIEMRYRNWKSNIKKLYGLSVTEYIDMFMEQDGKCAICGKHYNEIGTPYIDHCHKTSRVRGLLCATCNLMIGYANDNKEVMKNAIKYLERK